MGGSSGGTSTTISRTEPPKYVEPYSIEMMNKSAELSQRPYQAYGGQRIADFTPQHMAGLNMTEQRAMQGAPVMNATKDMITDTVSGNYLSPESNPYLSGMANTISNDVMNRMQGIARGSGSGTTNSGWQEATARGLGDSLANLYGQNYQAERTNQMRGAMFAPQLAQTDYADAQALLGVGDIYRDQNQAMLNQGYEDWNAQQQWPYQQLDILANGIRTSMGGGGTTVTSSPNAFQSNRTAGMIGGGLAGYGIGQSQNWNPYMSAGVGGLLGGLL